MTSYLDIVYLLESYGFTEVMLPFLLIFTIFFAILQRSEVLGKQRNFNVVVALVIGLTVVIPHSIGGYPAGYDAVEIINNALPSISIIAVASIAFLMIIGIFGAEKRWMGTSVSGWIAIFAFIAIGVIFASSAGWTGFYVEDYIDADTLTLIIIILVFAVIVKYITDEPGKGDGLESLGKGIEKFGDFFGKK